MNTRLIKNVPQTIGGVLTLIVLMCAGFFFYAQWDLKRFKESLEELPEVSPAAVPQTEKATSVYAEKPYPAETAAPKPSTQHNIEPESTEFGMEVPSLETPDSLMDEFSLSEMEHSKEETADVQGENLKRKETMQAGEFQEEIDSGSGFAGLISALESGNDDIGSGDSENVTIVVEMLKRAAKGPMTVNDLITMTEAWLRIQPDTPHVQSEVNETRDLLTDLLLNLQDYKEKSLQNGEEAEATFYIY